MNVRMIGAAAMLMACSGSSSDGVSNAPPTTPADPAPAPGDPPPSSSLSEPSSATELPEIDRFWKIFLAGDIDALRQVQVDLESAKGPNRTNPTLPLVLGMSYVWGTAENARRAEPIDVLEMIENADRVVLNLRRHTELLPNEPRAWAHLGTAMVSIGAAKGSGEQIMEGRAIVDEKVLPVEPAEAGFALGAALPRGPKGYLAPAIDYFFIAYETCVGHAIDRDAPSFDDLEARRTNARPLDVCFNQPHWPHAEEGNFLVFGDTLEKAGKKDAARKAWEAATKVPTFASWKFASVVEDRLAGKAHQGIGAEPSLCTQCHMK